MKFDIWTFLFQVINFIVLLFILKRLLYRPVRQILEKRRELIRESVENAEKTRLEAAELKEKLQAEMRGQETVRNRLFDEMRGTVLEEKKKLLAEAEKEAETRIERALALFAVEKSGFERDLKKNAVDAVSVYATSLLRDIADEELHRALWRRLLGKLGEMARTIGEGGIKENTVEIEVFSAYPLTAEEVTLLKSGMESQLARPVAVSTAVDEALIAGVRIRSRDMVYDASLAGQVNAFGVRLAEGD